MLVGWRTPGGVSSLNETPGVGRDLPSDTGNGPVSEASDTDDRPGVGTDLVRFPVVTDGSLPGRPQDPRSSRVEQNPQGLQGS